MFCNESVSFYFRSNKFRVAVLAIVWVLAFVLGGFWGWNYRSSFLRFIYWGAISRSNILVHIFVSSLTLLMSFFAIVFHYNFGIYVISFLEGIAFGSILVGLIGCFPSFGWLLALLFLTPKMIMLFLQFLYWQLCLSEAAVSAIRLFVLFLSIYFLIIILGRNLIDPTVFFLLDHL